MREKIWQIFRKQGNTNTAISPINKVKPVQQVYKLSNTPAHTKEESSLTHNPPDLYVSLTQVKAVQDHQYGNIKRKGMVIGDESTLLRASWALLGYVAKCGNNSSQNAKLTLLHDMQNIMQVNQGLRQAMEQSFLQGRAGQIDPKMVGNKLISWVGLESVLLDIVSELMVYMALAGQQPTQASIQHLSHGLKSLNISSIRLQHLIKLRQRELALGAYYKQPQGGFVAYTLPKPQEIHNLPKAVLDYAVEVLGLEHPYSLENAALITRALVMHYAPVRLSSQHVPRPLMKLCSKKLAECIAAYNLLREI